MTRFRCPAFPFTRLGGCAPSSPGGKVTTSSDQPAEATIGPSRLHWSSIVFRLGPTFRSALTLFILLAFARDSVYQLWALIGLIPLSIGGVITYFTLTY